MTGAPAHLLGADAATDAIQRFTRGVAALLGAAVLFAFVVLYFMPLRTAELFAWPVKPPLTAMCLGASYANGLVFFGAALCGRRWHAVAAPHWGVFGFAALILVATILHWDRFTHDHPVFAVWVFVYAAAPLLVPIAMLRNRRLDPRLPVTGERLVPRACRRAWLVPGTALLLFALAGFVWPQWLIPHWPWTVTPLTLRLLLSFYAMLGAAIYTVQSEARWSAWRGGAVGVALWHTLVLVAAALRADDLRPGTACGIWLGCEIALVLGTAVTFVWMERRAPRYSPA